MPVEKLIKTFFVHKKASHYKHWTNKKLPVHTIIKHDLEGGVSYPKSPTTLRRLRDKDLVQAVK